MTAGNDDGIKLVGLADKVGELLGVCPKMLFFQEVLAFFVFLEHLDGSGIERCFPSGGRGDGDSCVLALQNIVWMGKFRKIPACRLVCVAHLPMGSQDEEDIVWHGGVRCILVSSDYTENQ